MSTHYNVQIHVQRVTKEFVTGKPHGIQQAVTGQGRDVTEVLDIKVTADSEAEAYAKVQRIMVASTALLAGE